MTVITKKVKVVAVPVGPVERLFNSDDATNFFKGAKRPATGECRLVAP